MLRLVALVISISVLFPWLSSERRGRMRIFFLHWFSGAMYVMSQFIMSVMVLNCWSSHGDAGNFIFFVKFVELAVLNLWSISSLAIAILIASIVQSFAKFRLVPATIGSGRAALWCVTAAVLATVLSAVFWNGLLITGGYFWVTNTENESHARWITLSFGATQTLAGMLMAVAVLFTVTGERSGSLRVCLKTSQRVKFHFILTIFGTCVYLYNGIILLVDEFSDAKISKRLVIIGWCSRYAHVIADTGIIFGAFYALEKKEGEEARRQRKATVAGRRCPGSSTIVEGSTDHIMLASSKIAKNRRKRATTPNIVDDGGDRGGGNNGVVDVDLKGADDAFITPTARLSDAPAVGSGVTIGSNESANMVLIVGSLVVILSASAVDAASGAGATDAMGCCSPLDVVGLDNCPELKSNRSARNNSIVENLLAAKADMLRQVIEVLTNPDNAGEGGHLDEPLLLVRKLASDETDAIFGDLRAKYFRKYFGHVAHTGTWSPLPGGFNRWVETYYRRALNGTRPVLVTVHGDDVCELEKELSPEARLKAESNQAEDIGEDTGKDHSVETATPVESQGETTNDQGYGGNSTGKAKEENFEVPVVLMTLGWDRDGDPTHHVGAWRDRSCAYRLLEMGRVVKWFTSHARSDSRKHEKFRYLPIGFGGHATRNGLPQAAFIDAAKRQLDSLEVCPAGKGGSYDLLFQCSNMVGRRDVIWKTMTEGKGLGSPIPTNRAPLEPADYVTAAARGIFAVSPPGTGADCFRHYEMMLEGNIALVPYEFSLTPLMDGLPAFSFGGREEAERSWGNLTCGHLLEMAETVQAKIKQGKEGGRGLQYEKLTQGFWRRYIRHEVMLAGVVMDEEGAARSVANFELHEETSGSSRFLDAIIVTLNQACEGERWLASTKELQLASLQFCVACRDMPTLHLRVNRDIPDWLLTVPTDAAAVNLEAPVEVEAEVGAGVAADGGVVAMAAGKAAGARAGETVSRVPRLRARAVTWELPSAERLSSPIDALTAVEVVKFAGGFNDSVRSVAWPDKVRVVEFGRRFNQPMEGVAFPDSIESIAFGAMFRKSVSHVTWPTSLKRLSLGQSFNHPVSEVGWPPSLQELTFGDWFNQRLEGIALPASLQTLSLGRAFNQPIAGVALPQSLRRITFGTAFRQPIVAVAWPQCLQQLVFGFCFNNSVAGAALPSSLRLIRFGEMFNQPVAGVAWPASLNELEFLRDFNHPIDQVAWPGALEKLSFGKGFDQPIKDAAFPRSLERLSFGARFNQDVVKVAWPASLRSVAFGEKFNHPLEGITWPPLLRQISLGRDFNQAIGGVAWPRSLRLLTFGDKFNQPIPEGTGAWAESLEEVSFGKGFDQPVAHVSWGVSLKKMVFGEVFNKPIVGMRWSPVLQRLKFGSCFNQSVDGVVFPNSVEEITFGYEFDQSVSATTWPASLRRITFMGNFNKTITGVVWPSSVDAIEFGLFFNQPVAGAVFPASLEEITFGRSFNQPIDGTQWPPTLKRLRLGRRFRHPLDGLGRWMPNLEELTLLLKASEDYSLLFDVEWPKDLKKLTQGGDIGDLVELLVIALHLSMVSKTRRRLTPDDLVPLYHEKQQAAEKDSGRDRESERPGGPGRGGGWVRNDRKSMSMVWERQSRVEQWNKDKEQWADGRSMVLGAEVGHLPASQEVALLAGGVTLFLTIYGCMEEYLVVKIFERKLALFMTLLQFFGFAACAALWRGSQFKSGRAVPMKTYFGLGVLQAIMQGLANVSMLYLSYPAKVLFTSSRTVPIMFFGVVWQGRRYSFREYGAVCLLVTGLATFMAADDHSSTSDTPLPLSGVVPMSLAVVVAAVNFNVQEEVMNRHATEPDELTMFSHLCGTVYLALFCAFSGELESGVAFLRGKIVWGMGAVMLFCVSGFLGRTCMVALTKRFGEGHSAITTTTRKMVNVTLSVILFPKPFTLQHLVGVILFVIGLSVRIFRSEEFRRQPPSPTTCMFVSREFSRRPRRSPTISTFAAKRFVSEDLESRLPAEVVLLADSDRRQADVELPRRGRSPVMNGGLFQKATILDALGVADTPSSCGGHGVRLSVPHQSLRGQIGPITVEETAEIVDGRNGSVLVVMQVVHCLPAASGFVKPLMLDFTVGDDAQWSSTEDARENVLREYQVLSKQREGDPWQEMDPNDEPLLKRGSSRVLTARLLRPVQESHTCSEDC
eukprot:g7353.t1